MIIVSRTQFHVERPWGQRPFIIVVVAAFNQEKSLVGAFSVIVQPVVEPIERFTALYIIYHVYCLLLFILLCSDLCWKLSCGREDRTDQLPVWALLEEYQANDSKAIMMMVIISVHRDNICSLALWLHLHTQVITNNVELKLSVWGAFTPWCSRNPFLTNHLQKPFSGLLL